MALGSALYASLKKQYPTAEYYLDFKTPEQLLVATILSAQCTDKVVNRTTPALFKKYRNPKDFAAAPLAQLDADIKSVTFHTTKAKNIIACCDALVKQHGGKVPKTVEALTRLPGIGRKTANAILMNGYGIIVGIPVDTHVIRLSNRMGLTNEKNPDKIEQDLMKMFPKAEWIHLPYVMKAHGQLVCKAPRPKCDECVIKRQCPKIGVKIHA